MKEWFIKNKKTIFFTGIVFLFFAVITYLTPLAGDDWGYAYNGMKSNPIMMAFEFYNTWSGRFFSELWGFIVAPRKWLWNFLNPLLFTIIFVCIQKIANPEKKLIKYLLTVFLMLFVSANLRMETYTWIMGTTYVVPLALSLLFFSLELDAIGNHKKMKTCYFIFCLCVCFYIGLCMENIAVVMVFAHFLLVFYRIFNKESSIQEISFFAISLTSLILLRSSPGSASRLAENTAWNELNLIEQLLTNIPYFLKYSFYDNKYLIIFLNLILIVQMIKKEKNKKLKFIFFIVIICTVFALVSNKFYNLTAFEMLNFINCYFDNKLSLALNVVLWFSYIVILFLIIWRNYEDDLRVTLLYFVLLAGSSNLVMLLSPIFGSRSSLYFYYFCIILILLMMGNKTICSPLINKIVCFVLILFSGYRAKNILNKYKMVDSVYQDRLVKIQYYIDHPNEKDIWLPRMPIYTVHGADIEEEDTYHMEVFKLYYHLSDDCRLHFYVEE